MGKAPRYFDKSDGTSTEREPSAKKSVTSTDRATASEPAKSDQQVVTIVAKTGSKRRWMTRKEKDGKAVKKQFAAIPKPSKEQLRKYSRGPGLNKEKITDDHIRTSVRRAKILKRDAKIKAGIEEAAGAEILLLEEHGGIEVEQGESSLSLNQCDIVKQVDVASATKSFHLTLDQFAPYKVDYTLNGRQLALGGRKGHVAAFDWISKKLLCEFNVMESVHDVKWLHNETMFAVAQKQWTYVYDNQGLEIHCLKKMDRVMKLEFLPYHFLLVGGHESGFLSWVDVSVGKIVAQFGARHGSLGVLTANPSNAIIHCGHSNGTVTLWSPNVKTSLASVLCHGSAISAVAVDNTGRLMATGAMDGRLRIWDLRNSYTPLTSATYGTPSAISFSQTGLLAYSCANTTRVYSEVGQSRKPFLKHVSHGNVTSAQFCPFEDVLGLGTARGFDSCLVPGAGEANFDALERNPFQTKKQRREAEVKALLEKIQPELITLDNKLLGDVDTESLKNNIDEKPKYIKKSEIDLAQRRKRKAAKIPKAKQSLQSELNLRNLREASQHQKIRGEDTRSKELKLATDDPLNRFVRKKKIVAPPA